MTSPLSTLSADQAERVREQNRKNQAAYRRREKQKKRVAGERTLEVERENKRRKTDNAQKEQENASLQQRASNGDK